MNAPDNGLFGKFIVNRVDGRDAPGEKHAGCEYFVLDLSHDSHALPAIAAYAQSCEQEYPALAADLKSKIIGTEQAKSEFILVPETTLPDGTIVASFRVARYPMSKGASGAPLSVADRAPWVEINYEDTRKVCEDAGLKLIRETQMLAIAWDISQQAINWTGDKVGEGTLYQGLHKGSVDEAQPGNYESADPAERSWHELSTGERIYHFSGNVYTWVFDDVQGDENGLVAKSFAADSISITTPPVPSGEQGVGWYPPAGRDWSGSALARGGCWSSDVRAGVFYLNGGWPDGEYVVVGFRSTL